MKQLLATLSILLTVAAHSTFASVISSSITFVETSGTVDLSSALDWMIFGDDGSALDTKEGSYWSTAIIASTDEITTDPFDFITANSNGATVSGDIGTKPNGAITISYRNMTQIDGIESGTVRLYVTLPETSLFELTCAGEAYSTTESQTSRSGYIEFSYTDNTYGDFVQILSLGQSDDVTIYAVTTNAIPEPAAISLIALAGMLTISCKRIFCT